MIKIQDGVVYGVEPSSDETKQIFPVFCREAKGDCLEQKSEAYVYWLNPSDKPIRQDSVKGLRGVLGVLEKENRSGIKSLPAIIWLAENNNFAFIRGERYFPEIGMTWSELMAEIRIDMPLSDFVEVSPDVVRISVSFRGTKMTVDVKYQERRNIIDGLPETFPKSREEILEHILQVVVRKETKKKQ